MVTTMIPSLRVRGGAFQDEAQNFVRFVRHPTLEPRLLSPIRISVLDRIHRGCGGVANAIIDDLFSGLFTRLWGITAMISFCASVCISMLTQLVAETAGIDNKSTGIDKSVSDDANASILRTAVIAPVWEEIKFHGMLRYPAPATGFILMAGSAMMLPGSAYMATRLACLAFMAFESLARGFREAAKPSTCDGIYLPRSAERFLQWSEQLPARKRQYEALATPALVYISNLAFAAAHLANFKHPGSFPFWFKPLAVLPQFVGGLAGSWLRLRCGIGAAIAEHAFHNALCVYMLPQRERERKEKMR